MKASVFSRTLYLVEWKKPPLEKNPAFFPGNKREREKSSEKEEDFLSYSSFAQYFLDKQPTEEEEKKEGKNKRYESSSHMNDTLQIRRRLNEMFTGKRTNFPRIQKNEAGRFRPSPQVKYGNGEFIRHFSQSTIQAKEAMNLKCDSWMAMKLSL